MGDGSAVSGAVVTAGGRVPNSPWIVGVIRALKRGAVQGLYLFSDDDHRRKSENSVVLPEEFW